MPICKKCNSHFPNRKKINGKNRDLSNRKYCLTCSPFGGRNTKKLEVNDIPDEKKCTWCNLVKPKSYFYKRTDRVGLSHYCKECSAIQNREGQVKRARNRKIKLIIMHGGCCKECGYDKNLASLTFHHKDQSKKETSLSSPSLRSMTWKACIKEAEKCIVLCANCHLEIHNKDSNNWKDFIKK